MAAEIASFGKVQTGCFDSDSWGLQRKYGKCLPKQFKWAKISLIFIVVAWKSAQKGNLRKQIRFQQKNLIWPHDPSNWTIVRYPIYHIFFIKIPVAAEIASFGKVQTGCFDSDSWGLQRKYGKCLPKQFKWAKIGLIFIVVAWESPHKGNLRI